MPTDSVTVGLYDSLLAEHETARSAGLLEVSYHALAAALHCAEALDDELRVRHVQTLAERLRSGLDREHPQHRLATESAGHRGQSSVFATLAVQAESIAIRLRAARVMTRSRSVRQSQQFAFRERVEPRDSSDQNR